MWRHKTYSINLSSRICAAQNPYCSPFSRIRHGNGSEIPLTLLLSTCQGEEQARSISLVPHHKSLDGKTDRRRSLWMGFSHVLFLDVSKTSNKGDVNPLLTVPL